MQIKRIFEVKPKSISEKPLYVKPKNKTYRELLNLDRPKKLIHLESDDENDDFLEKLMKREKKKENESKKKKSLVANRKLIENQPSQILQHVPQESCAFENTTKPKEVEEATDANEIDILKSHESNEKQMNVESNSPIKQIKQESIEAKSLEKISIRKKNSSELAKQYKSKQESDKQKKLSIQNEEEIKNMIEAVQEQTNKFIINSFIANHQLKKSTSFKDNKKKHFLSIHNENRILTKINPESKEILHQISPKKLFLCNSNNTLRTNEYMQKSIQSFPFATTLISESLNEFSKHKLALIARKSLFKTSYQEELFLKSLKRK